METSLNEGDSKLHTDLNRLLKENDNLKQEKEVAEASVVNMQEQLANMQKDVSQLKKQVKVHAGIVDACWFLAVCNLCLHLFGRL